MKRYLFYSLLNQIGVDTPLYRSTCYKHNIHQTHRNGSSNYTFTFSFYFNISNT